MGCCASFARCLLIMFNFFFWLSGAAILGVGIWILVDKDLQDYLDVIKDAMEDEDALRNAAYILIGFGTFVFIVGFCGCCGAIRRSKCLLGFYILFLIIVFGGEMAVGIYVVLFQNDAEDKLDSGLEKSIKEHYGETLKGAWDLVQKELQCCGGNSYTEYTNSTWRAEQDPSIMIPESCCKLNADGTPINITSCQKAEGEFYDQGCKDELMDWIKDNSIILIGVGFGIAALELLGLICAICFCRHMDKDKYEQN